MTAHRSDIDTVTAGEVRGSSELLLYENLAIARMREAHRVAAEQRLAHRLHTLRRWKWVARWAAKRADRAASVL